jgi:hypothetical protein
VWLATTGATPPSEPDRIEMIPKSERTIREIRILCISDTPYGFELTQQTVEVCFEAGMKIKKTDYKAGRVGWLIGCHPAESHKYL